MLSPNVSIGEPNELGPWRLSTSWSVTSSTPSFRTLGAFGWHVPCLLLRRDGERFLWNQLWRFDHFQRYKLYDFNM